MVKFITEKVKSFLLDFKKYSIIYKLLYRLHVRKCKKLFNKFICDDNNICLFIGLPGAGKTTFISFLSYICHVVGYPTWCNVPIKFCKPFSKDDIGIYDMTNDSKGGLTLLDEAGIMYDNRKFSDSNQFTEDSLRFLKLIRHYRSHVFLFSQSMDIDNKWIRLSKNVYFVRRSLIPGYTSITRIRRTLDVNPDTHKIEDFYDKDNGILHKIFHFRFRRKPFYKMFDSYAAPKLKPFPNIKKYEEYKIGG